MAEPQPSKLAMRVRFPSSALMTPLQVSGILRFFSRHFYEACLGRRARCVPDRFGSVPVVLVLVFLASAKSLPMPAAIFWARLRRVGASHRRPLSGDLARQPIGTCQVGLGSSRPHEFGSFNDVNQCSQYLDLLYKSSLDDVSML